MAIKEYHPVYDQIIKMPPVSECTFIFPFIFLNKDKRDKNQKILKQIIDICDDSVCEDCERIKKLAQAIQFVKNE